MTLKSFKRAILTVLIASVSHQDVLQAEKDIPIITNAEANVETMTLSIAGSGFIETPLPTVFWGTELGGFDRLTVIAATSTNITASLLTVKPGTYRLIAQFGPRDLLIATLDVTIGAAGPKGDKGDQGDPGSGSVTAISAGAGLEASPNPIIETGTLSVASGGITNDMLLNSSLTITTLNGSGLSGGGAIPLGGSLNLTNTGDTNTADDITSLSAGTGISISGAGNSRTVTNTGDTNPGDDLTSLIAGNGISIAGAGNSRTISAAFGGITNGMLMNSSLTINTTTGLSGGGTISLGESLNLTNTGDTDTTDDITSLIAGDGIAITGSGNSRTISAAAVSDRNAKENFLPVDGLEVLERVARIPLSTWNYQNQSPAIRHMGPMAQDFYAAFRMGRDDLRITSMDVDGVSLAAIQALHRLLRENEAKLTRLKEERDGQEQQIAALEVRLRALEALMSRD